MQSFFSNLRQPHAEQLFYIEQWTALIVGIGCVGISVWSGLHDYGYSLPQAQLEWQRNLFIDLRWPLAIAIALIGTVLIRFAFFNGRKTQRPEETPIKGSESPVLLASSKERQ